MSGDLFLSHTSVSLRRGGYSFWFVVLYLILTYSCFDIIFSQQLKKKVFISHKLLPIFILATLIFFQMSEMFICQQIMSRRPDGRQRHMDEQHNP